MSKRKPAKVIKQAHGNAAVKPQRTRQAVIKAPKLRVAPHKLLQKEKGRDAPVFKKPVEIVLPVVESPALASQSESEITTTASNVIKSLDVFPAPEKLETAAEQSQMSQAIQLAYEFAHNVSQIKSPFEFPNLFLELTIKQFAMFHNLAFPHKRPH